MKLIYKNTTKAALIAISLFNAQAVLAGACVSVPLTEVEVERYGRRMLSSAQVSRMQEDTPERSLGLVGQNRVFAFKAKILRQKQEIIEGALNVLKEKLLSTIRKKAPLISYLSEAVQELSPFTIMDALESPQENMRYAATSTASLFLSRFRDISPSLEQIEQIADIFEREIKSAMDTSK